MRAVVVVVTDILLQEATQMSLADAYDHASRVIVDNMLAGDEIEGIDAFFNKRKPEWENG